MIRREAVRFYCSSVHFHFNTLIMDGFDNQVCLLKHGGSDLDVLRRGPALEQDGTRQD